MTCDILKQNAWHTSDCLIGRPSSDKGLVVMVTLLYVLYFIVLFSDNDITIEHFPKLTQETLKELCPHLATRISLQEKITELINAQASTV